MGSLKLKGACKKMLLERCSPVTAKELGDFGITLQDEIVIQNTLLVKYIKYTF
jgi:hypothetical protein